MGAARCWTIAELRSAKALFENGKTLPEIGMYLCRSPEGVRKALNLAGVALQRGRKPHRHLRKGEEEIGLMSDDRKMRKDAIQGSQMLLRAIEQAGLVAA